MFPRVIQLQYANLTNMYAVLTNALPSGRKVKEDTRTSSLVITASEKDFEMIQQILEKLDTPTRQILIEAKIMETSRNPKTIKGIDWAGTLSDQAITFGNGRTVGQTVTEAPGPAESITTTLPSGRQITSTTRSRYESNTKLLTDLGFGGLSVDTARGFFPHVAFLNADGLKVALSFLNSDSDTEIVATPRAVTLDNETAKLSITRLYPNFKITPGTQNTPAGAEITYTNLGTTLEVTPRIAGTNDAVSLKVVPEIGNIDSVDRKTVNNSVNEANVYAVRRIETHVMIPSGNTLVMGGLMSDQKTKAYSKVPILGDMPLLGLAFRRENKQRSKVNMLIFVTPTIVKPNDFQPTQSTFLQTRPKPDDDREESAWDSGKPYDWKSGLAPIK
jgi:general secretion pathway protein D